jgi:hypothetical protein
MKRCTFPEEETNIEEKEDVDTEEEDEDERRRSWSRRALLLFYTHTRI